MVSRTIEVRATEFRDINEAMGFAEADGTKVVSVGGRYLVMADTSHRCSGSTSTLAASGPAGGTRTPSPSAGP